ncbi:MAG TPA: ATP-binding protein [Chitinophagaceae bacterium]|nr:ATP-binding protein [Chitinophagaceae bacterium]
MLPRLVLIACCMLCGSDLLSQRYPFINYTPIDGLVNNQVRTMFQDSRGRIFFLTSNGLSIYDGARFTNYTMNEGLAHNVINDILEITPDSFLVATNINRLNCLVRGKIFQVKTSDGFYPVINSFYRTKNGTIFVAADDGLFKWQSNRFVQLPVHFQDAPEGKYFTAIKEVGKYLLLLVNPGLSRESGTVFLYDPTNQPVLHRHTVRKTFHWATSPQGDVWLTGSGGLSVLKKNELEQGIFKEHPLPVEYSSLQKKMAALVKFDKLGQLWLSVGEGILLFKPGRSPVIYNEASGLGSSNIVFIFHDKEGNNWFLPDGGGAQKLVGSNIALLDRAFGSKSIGDLSGSPASDSVWLSSDYGADLTLVSAGTVKRFSSNLSDAGRRFVVQDGNYLFTIDGKNITKYEVPKTGTKLKVICHYSHSNNQISYGILDPNRNAVFCTNYTLRVILKDCSNFFYPLHYYADQLCFDKNGNLWVATRSNKLLSLSLHPDNPDRYLQLKHDFSDQMKVINPRSIAVDDSNRIWIGTRFEGLYCYALDSNRLQLLHHLTKKNGLTEDFINFLAYHDQTIWASSPAGLDRINIVNKQAVIENITESNKIYVSLRKIVLDQSGTVWAVGQSGNMIRVNRPEQKEEAPEPKFFISQIHAGKKIFVTSDSVHQFKHTDNNISFFVAAPSFYNEKEIKYSYILEGTGNHQWSEPSSDAALHLVNLAPGNYSLKLKAEFPAGKYPPQLLNYAFVVNPPWWQTWWFRGLMVMAAIGFFIAIVRRYYRSKYLKQKILLEKQQAVDKERTRIATDMHDDLGAGLSRIKFLSESIQIKKSGDESVMGEVQKIAAYSDEMVEKMGEIVWALSEKNDSLQHLVAFTRSYAADYLATNNIECIFSSSDEIPTSFVTGEVRRNVFLSVKESLHNVVKHAGARTVTIKVSLDPNLKFSIQDDGKGIDWNHIRPFSNGLSNIRKRMEEIGGKAEIQNTAGTEVILDVPLKG